MRMKKMFSRSDKVKVGIVESDSSPVLKDTIVYITTDRFDFWVVGDNWPFESVKTIFSCESSSRNANIRLSVCLSVLVLTLVSEH